MKPFERAYNFLIIGVQGSGKTQLATDMAKVINPLRELYVAPDDMEPKLRGVPEIEIANTEKLRTFEGKRKAFYEEGDFYHIYRHYHNGMLVMDDAANYVGENGKVEEALKRTIRRSRQKRLFVLMVTHNFGDTPPFMFRFASDYILYYTEDEIATRKRYLPSYSRFHYIKKIVDHISSMDEMRYRYKHGVHISKQELISGKYDIWILENMKKYFPGEVVKF